MFKKIKHFYYSIRKPIRCPECGKLVVRYLTQFYGDDDGNGSHGNFCQSCYENVFHECLKRKCGKCRKPFRHRNARCGVVGKIFVKVQSSKKLDYNAIANDILAKKLKKIQIRNQRLIDKTLGDLI